MPYHLLRFCRDMRRTGFGRTRSVQALRAYMALRNLHITPVAVFVGTEESECESSDDDSLPSLISYDDESESSDDVPPLISYDDNR